jgi:hypothetical protein
MERITTLKQLREKNKYLISFDLKEMYSYVTIHESLRTLLGILWRGKLYQFIWYQQCP